MEERMRELEKRVEALEAQLDCKSKRKKYNQDYYQKKKKEKKKEERALRHMNPRLNTISRFRLGRVEQPGRLGRICPTLSRCGPRS